MRSVVFLVLLSSAVLAAGQRLTPATKLPTAFDDLVHNSLQQTADISSTAKHLTIKVKETIPLLTFLNSNAFFVNAISKSAIVSGLKNLKEGEIQTHFLFAAVPTLASFKFAMVNIMKEGEEYKIVLTWDEKKAFGVRKLEFYHDVSTSTLGLPHVSRTVVINTSQKDTEAFDFYRNSLLASIKDVRGSQAANSLGFDIGAAISSATGAIKGITDAYSSIVSAFKTVKKEEFKQKINGEGFSNFRSTSRFIRSLGIPLTKWEVYKTSYYQLLRLNSNTKLKKDVDAIMTMAEFIPDNSWNFNDMTFDIGKGGVCDSFVAMTRNDMLQNVVHVVTVVANGTFKLADDILVYENYKSVAGGIVETTKTKMVNKPRGMTMEEAKAINAFMMVNALEVLAQNFGVKWTIPEKLL